MPKKWIILGVNSQNRQALGAESPDSHLDSITRECARPYSHWTFLVDADARQFGGKTKLYIFCSHQLSKTLSRASDGTNSRYSALLCNAFASLFTFLYPSAG